MNSTANTGISTEPILRAEQLRRVFTRKGEDDRVAVDDVSVTIHPGEIVCILGPNGAGKTTTVRMCGTLLSPTSGRVFVDGIDAIANPREARRRTGLVLGGDTGFYSRATARKNLLFFADVARVRGAARRSRVNAVLAAVDLSDRADEPVRNMSRGMKQRLHIARALLSEPRLLLLDEPTNGLDPQIATETRSLVRSLAEQGTGILLTSHYMAEVEQLADVVQVIAQGREIAKGTVPQIAAAAGFPQVTTFSTTRATDELADLLGDAAGPIDVADSGGRWQVRIPWRDQPRDDLVRAWLGELPADFFTRPATLEESYLALVESVGGAAA